MAARWGPLSTWHLAALIEAAPRNRRCLAGNCDANWRGQIRERIHSIPSIRWLLGSVSQNNSETFWTLMMVLTGFSSASRRSIRRRRAAFSSASGSIFSPRFHLSHLGSQSLEYAFARLQPPLSQVRGVESLSAKHGPYLAGFGAVVSLRKDAQLVIGGNPASLRLDQDLWIHSGE